MPTTEHLSIVPVSTQLFQKILLTEYFNKNADLISAVLHVQVWNCHFLQQYIIVAFIIQ
jgi:hypothetical protein